jgi:hypothetical protein
VSPTSARARTSLHPLKGKRNSQKRRTSSPLAGQKEPLASHAVLSKSRPSYSSCINAAKEYLKSVPPPPNTHTNTPSTVTCDNHQQEMPIEGATMRLLGRPSRTGEILEPADPYGHQVIANEEPACAGKRLGVRSACKAGLPLLPLCLPKRMDVTMKMGAMAPKQWHRKQSQSD